MAKRMKWLTSHKRLIMDNPGMTDNELAMIIGTDKFKVRAFRHRMGVKRSDQFLEYCRKNNRSYGGGRPVK